MMADAKLTGKVKFFDSVKGFGFIIPDDGSAELFVHQSSLHAEGFRSLGEGELVEFNIKEGEGRRYAADVTGPGGVFVQGARRKEKKFGKKKKDPENVSA